MRLREIFNIRVVIIMLAIFAFIVSNNTLLAQNQDTTVSSTTAAIDTAVKAGTTEITLSAAPLISTAVDTVARYKNMQQVVAKADHSAAYKSGAYYLLLFLLLCIFIGIIGKILNVYELSREIQGVKSKFDLRKVQGVLLGLVLFIGLYGVYWSYSVQGAMSMHESASEHGVDIDSMFNITVIITSIVFILTHVILFGFAYQYRGSEKKKAFFFPVCLTIFFISDCLKIEK